MEYKRVLVIIDGPNFHYSMKKSKLHFNFGELLKIIGENNPEMPILKLFFDEMPGEDTQNYFYVALSKMGFELIPVPLHIYGISGQISGRNYKSGTDQMITIHLMEHLLKEEFDTLLFFTGDSDYRFVLQKVVDAGKKIRIYSTSASLSSALIKITPHAVRLDKIRKDSVLLLQT